MPPVVPQPGDIGLVPIKGGVGLAIRFGQWLNGSGFANYEHAFVFVGQDEIVEAEPDGARLANLDEYDGRTIAWLRCPDEHRQAVADAARTFIGTPYGFLDYAVIAAHRFHLPIPGLTRIANSRKSIICSELAVMAARLGGWPLCGDKPAGFVTPDDLDRYVTP
jgi:hypothetical protein